MCVSPLLHSIFLNPLTKLNHISQTPQIKLCSDKSHKYWQLDTRKRHPKLAALCRRGRQGSAVTQAAWQQAAHVECCICQCHRGYGDGSVHPDMLQPMRWAPAMPWTRGVSARGASGFWGEAAQDEMRRGVRSTRIATCQTECEWGCCGK